MEDDTCPRCGEEEDTPDHIVFRCSTIKRVKDQREDGESGLRWDSWDALAEKKWVRMEDTSHVDVEGRAVLKKVDLMEELFKNIQRQI